ncbi:MAG: hypothetical protein Q8T08_14425, partial [Ignavibacteria bacterium]|nr:hypothetical protein [Ignavibacteria bacterium]
MRKFTLLIIILWSTHVTVVSQSCLPDGITFTNQAAIDNFQTNFPDCNEIEGNVLIEGTSINNLNGLSVLASIGGDLVISGNDSLTSLSGIDNLASIGGNLNIAYNALTNIEGLDNLISIGGDLIIARNNALTSLSGINNLASIGGDLDITWNDALTSITGLGK